jgi:hypothetical protein
MYDLGRQAFWFTKMVPRIANYSDSPILLDILLRLTKGVDSRRSN